MYENDVISHNIYKSGINLIRIGILDADIGTKEKDARRLLTSIMNAYAGVLLLLKSHLAYLSAKDLNCLIYESKSLKPIRTAEGRVKWESGSRKKTINVHEIRERFDQLDVQGLGESFWMKIKKIGEFRNDAEHFFVSLKEDVLWANLFEVREVLDVLLNSVINILPSDKDAVAEEWTLLNDKVKISEALRQKRNEGFGHLKWLSSRLREMAEECVCPDCGYPIIGLDKDDGCGEAVDSVFKCASCGRKFEYADLIELALSTQPFDEWVDWKEIPYLERHIGECPNCERYGFDANTDKCYCCGYEQQHVCDVCSNKLRIEEIESIGLDGKAMTLCFNCRNGFEESERD